MLKINQNTTQTSNTLAMDGIEYNNAFTTTFMPSNLDMALNGLKPLSERNAFKFFGPNKEESDMTTIKTSNKFQKFVKYFTKPSAKSLIRNSNVNTTAKK